MKKSSLIALLLGTVSGILFAIGMCMTLIPEWNSFNQGIIFGCAGLVLGLITIFVWRRLEHKAPVRISGKNILTVITGIAGALMLGIGMCFCMVWENLTVGIIIGLAGIILLLCLIPLIKGIKD